MNQILRQMAVMSLALVLLCACAVTQNEKNTPINESRSNTNIAVANSSGITFSPSPCEVYQGEKVDVFVTLPEGYDRIQFVNGTGTGEYYTAEICYVNNRLAIRVTGKSDKVFKGIQEETITISAMRELPNYNTRNNNSDPTESFTVFILHK